MSEGVVTCRRCGDALWWRWSFCRTCRRLDGSADTGAAGRRVADARAAQARDLLDGAVGAQAGRTSMRRAT